MSETRKKILEDLESKGLAFAEDRLEDGVRAIFDGAIKSIEESKSKIDDLALPILKWVKNYLLKKIDKIDPSDNEPKV